MTMNLPRSMKKISFGQLVLLDQQDYTIVNKPPYLSSLEDRANNLNLLSLAKEANESYQLCHRLDKETSGVIVLAKNPEAYRNFALQLENREVKKIYNAVLDGRHKFEDFEADEPLNISSSKSRVDLFSGRASLTLVHTLEVYKKNTLVKCFPVTGRLHQIRVHLAYHHAPITSDPLYGGNPMFLSKLKRNFNIQKDQEEKPLIARVALHARQIAFKNLSGEVIEVEAPYPKDFAVLVKLLRKYN